MKQSNTLEQKGSNELLLKSETSKSESLNIPSGISSANRSSTEIVKSSNKNLSYIFKLDATRRKLESINKKIEKLFDDASDLNALITEKHRVYVVLEKHYYDVYVKRQEMLSAFHQSLTLHGIGNVNQVTEQEPRDKFLQKYTKPEEKKQMSDMLDSLYISFLNTGVQQSVLDDLNQQMIALQKEILRIDKQFDDNQKLLKETTKQFNDVDTEGLLKSYEFSGPKASIHDFVSNPHIEAQMKRLISLYNNSGEAMKFGLKLPKGILLLGDGETGKTFAARVFAAEIDRKIYHIKAHDLFSEDVNDPNEMLYIIFYNIIDHVKKTKESCVIFLDEIEKIISNMGEYSPAEEKMISNTIIKNITNIQKSGLDIVIIGAVGQKNKIDERFLKYDMFDNQVFLELPGAEERKRLFQINIQKAERRAKLKLFDPDILEELVKKTEGFSAEYIKQLIAVCVKERFHAYLQNKQSFAIDKDFIGTVSAQIQDSQTSEISPKKILSYEDRQKIINVLITQNTVKYLVFGEMNSKKKNDLLAHILDITEGYSENMLNEIISLCVDEYQKRESDYHKASLVNKEFIFEKIQELRDEDKSKGNKMYFSNK